MGITAQSKRAYNIVSGSNVPSEIEDDTVGNHRNDNGAKGNVYLECMTEGAIRIEQPPPKEYREH